MLRQAEAHEPRGLPLPGDLPFLQADDLASSSCSSRSRRSAARGARSTRLRTLEEPDAVRRAQDRLDGRAGGGGARRAGKLVAAVIYNRLHDRMPLGIDATLRYGLHIPPTKSITQSELASSNPYNTRRLYGLPPTPIANPGLASIQAAAHPAQVGYLYYVRKPGPRSTTSSSTSSIGVRRSTSRPTTTVRTRDDARRAARASGLALALAADAERRVRGGPASTGTTRRSTSRIPSRRSARSASSASPART